MKETRCRDCGCREGEIHYILGCDLERCPFCGRQLSMCGCVYKILRIHLDPGEFVRDLTPEQESSWARILEAKGRIPYIKWPNVCARCGVLWPELFSVPNEEWERYVEPAQRDKILCRTCYDEVKYLIDEGARRIGCQ